MNEVKKKLTELTIYTNSYRGGRAAGRARESVHGTHAVESASHSGPPVSATAMCLACIHTHVANCMDPRLGLALSISGPSNGKTI
jgi:hypothetical protein